MDTETFIEQMSDILESDVIFGDYIQAELSKLFSGIPKQELKNLLQDYYDEINPEYLLECELEGVSKISGLTVHASIEVID